MKAKHAITLLVLGYCLDFVAALQKIMHQPSADTLFYVATGMKVLGGLLFLYKLTRYPKLRDFMES